MPGSSETIRRGTSCTPIALAAGVGGGHGRGVDGAGRLGLETAAAGDDNDAAVANAPAIVAGRGMSSRF